MSESGGTSIAALRSTDASARIVAHHSLEEGGPRRTPLFRPRGMKVREEDDREEEAGACPRGSGPRVDRERVCRDGRRPRHSLEQSALEPGEREWPLRA